MGDVQWIFVRYNKSSVTKNDVRGIIKQGLPVL